MDSAVMSAVAQYCADCKASRPRYANITLGIWLCNHCYGIHRNVGAHVTRTKCVGLDSWSTQELHRMKSIGNERAASYWEGAELENGGQRVAVSGWGYGHLTCLTLA
ncbi:hypothetical protein MPTK1_2g07400 [Marchantia polymorpha subsp. ruderalis]|uniref:Arf-GAP domain-containing protein n=2 Tax=Marchantia polymorpha TaxID=3197 RepID=A0A176WHW0_MARPO|nr:hypothetical protein AXG93_3384s2120 [Marchantia polymorpha subsp. ruderalis]PTQ45208.1 hypothetical protein MARPO_0015s0027 [Marchantia polymorpha]BBN01441.1 hypothetical protein Mp_2g07400 [Marchantia polymorpha subsp. ruderalis]|eukprot:PTQ45208.1 hypothetical protein MARPO_0015s0027 [Marchantia polymorpha]